MKKIIILCIAVLFMTSAVLTAQAYEWEWVEQGGGSGPDIGWGIIADADGNSYVTGYFMGTATFGDFTIASSGAHDVFVAKLGTDGNWQWVTQAGGSSVDFGMGISVDADGNLYVIGRFGGIAYFGDFTITSSGNDDIFVAKLDADGDWLWATQAGGSSSDIGPGIIVDANGDLYVTGSFAETAAFGDFTLTSSGDRDVFVAKLGTDGNWLWAEQAGGSDDDNGRGISVDADGNSYVSGMFEGTATFGADELTSSGMNDVYVAKLGTDGNWQWVKQAGGSSSDVAHSISVDADGNLYVTGFFRETATFGDFTLTSSGEHDIFVAELGTDGDWQWVKQAGGSGIDVGEGISVDANGNLYVTGHFEGTAAFGDTTLTSSGGGDIYVAGLDADGNWQWATQAGGSGYDEGDGISVDANGNSYVIGAFLGTATFGPFTLTSSGGPDVFVAKITGPGFAVDDPGSDTKFEDSRLHHYPNPVMNSTSIEYAVKGMPRSEKVEIAIYNTRGQLVDTIEGRNGTAIWDTQTHTNGIYYYKVDLEKITSINKMIVIH